MARRLLGPGLVLILLGLALRQVALRISSGVDYWRNMATVRRADTALARGELSLAMQLLAGAGAPGQKRLAGLMVESHTPTRWSKVVQAVQAGGEDVRRALQTGLRRSAEERLCTAEALAALDDPAGVQALAAALLHPEVQAHDPADLACLGPPGVRALFNTARHGPRRAGEHAVQLLGCSPDATAGQALLDLVLDRSSSHRVCALRAGRTNHSIVFRPYLARFMADPDLALRAEAAYQLGISAGTRSLPALGKALHDPAPAVRAAAVEAAALIEGPEADTLLIRALGDPERSIVRKAIWSLAYRRSRKAETALMRLYLAADRSLQRDVVTALSWIGSPLAVEYRKRWEADTAGEAPLNQGPKRWSAR